MKDVKIILAERREDRRLRKEIEEWIGVIPEPLQDGPRAVLARAVATPNRESHRFAEVVQGLGLRPLWMTYKTDKFTSANPSKKALGKMVFHCGVGRNGGDIRKNQNIVDINSANGKPIADVKTFWGESLVDLHHRLLTKSIPGAETWEGSAWLKRVGGVAQKYYPKYLGLFLLHGVLAENFLTDGKEAGFTKTVVEPAMDELEQRFGLHPLVVPTLPPHSAGDPEWEWYDGELLPALHPQK